MRKFVAEISLSINEFSDSVRIKSGHVHLSSEYVFIWHDSGPKHYENILEKNKIAILEVVYVNWFVLNFNWNYGHLEMLSSILKRDWKI